MPEFQLVYPTEHNLGNFTSLRQIMGELNTAILFHPKTANHQSFMGQRSVPKPTPRHGVPNKNTGPGRASSGQNMKVESTSPSNRSKVIQIDLEFLVTSASDIPSCPYFRAAKDLGRPEKISTAVLMMHKASPCEGTNTIHLTTGLIAGVVLDGVPAVSGIRCGP